METSQALPVFTAVEFFDVDLQLYPTVSGKFIFECIQHPIESIFSTSQLIGTTLTYLVILFQSD